MEHIDHSVLGRDERMETRRFYEEIGIQYNNDDNINANDNFVQWTGTFDS